LGAQRVSIRPTGALARELAHPTGRGDYRHLGVVRSGHDLIRVFWIYSRETVSGKAILERSEMESDGRSKVAATLPAPE
jgi:hypothetical protein